MRNLKREYGKLLSLLQAYAIVAKGVRIVVTNQAGRAPRSTVVHTQGGALKDNLVTVFGAKVMASLVPFAAELEGGVRVSGYLSSATPGAGRSSGERQFFFINGRPVDLPQVRRRGGARRPGALATSPGCISSTIRSRSGVLGSAPGAPVNKLSAPAVNPPLPMWLPSRWRRS